MSSNFFNDAPDKKKTAAKIKAKVLKKKKEEEALTDRPTSRLASTQRMFNIQLPYGNEVRGNN